jgi:ubiquinone/menaquinone biosynthesis C-methylase UbiE
MLNLKKLKSKIINSAKKLPKSSYCNYHLINELILVNLETENLIFKKNYNPTKDIFKLLTGLENKVKLINNTNKFSNFSQTNKQSFKLEKSHQELFQKLWINYTKKQYIKERIGRYNNRIRINNLTNKIKNKSIVDFGCGHGNFLIAASLLGAKKCVGIDYGKDSIDYAKKISKQLGLSKKIQFYSRNIYSSKLKDNSFDFAIQNGVFHHMDYPQKAYKEVIRVLKPDGYFWTYTDGGGGLRDLIGDMSQEILKDINIDFKISTIRGAYLNFNKQYHISDNMNAKYQHFSKNTYLNYLKSFGFKNFIQQSGGTKTDFDEVSSKDKYFKIKFGSGDLRFVCQKK